MSRTHRPFTWGGAQPGSSFSSPTSPAFEGAAYPFDSNVPELYKQAWNQVLKDASNDRSLAFGNTAQQDNEIHLGVLHNVLCTAGGLGAGTAEKVINQACKGARCSRVEFFLSLGLLKQAQDGHPLDISRVQEQIAAGDIDVPALDFSRISPGQPSNHTFPPQASASNMHSRPAAPEREMSNPWTSNSIGADNNASNGTSNHRVFEHYDGLPQDRGGSFDPTFRGFAANRSGSLGAERQPNGGGRSHYPDETTRSNLFAHPEEGEARGSNSSMGGASTGEALSATSRFQSRENASSRERPFSYMSDTAETNAVDAAEDPAAELPEDEVAVRLCSELEGFIIKHNVYVVNSSLRKSSVTRRYSDWVWLAECLVKRYPFRCLPILPPKRLAVPIAGRHLTAEDQFIERRRRGLERYLKVLCSHPVLRQDKLVNVFFIEKRSLSEWRNTAPPLYLDEEGLTKVVDEAARMGIPDDLDNKLTQQRKAIPELLERWTSMAALFERIVKRNDAAAADYSRLNFSLLSVIEVSSKRWRPESDNRKTTEETMITAAAIFQDHSDMTSSRVTAISLSTLEGLKAQRELILSFRDLVFRLDRLLPDPIDTLKKRIETAQRKMTTLAASASSNPSIQQEQATLSAQVKQDTQSIQKYLNRRIHTKKTIWEELIWFHHRFKAIEEDFQKFVRDETYFLSTLTRVWETTEMKMKMIR